MPSLHNPTSHNLFCVRLQRFLAADERVEISDDEADELEHGVIFVVGREEKSSAPVRQTAKRGGKKAEVTEAPAVEKRG